jgi:cell division protein FtsB
VCEDIEQQIVALQQRLRQLDDHRPTLAAENAALTTSLLRQQQYLPILSTQARSLSPSGSSRTNGPT